MDSRSGTHSEHGLSLAIDAAGDLAQLGMACRRGAQALGFQHMLYALRYAPAGGAIEQCVLCGYPKAWRSRYDEQGYLLIDPVVARCIDHVTPFGWDELPRDKPGARQMFDDAARHGLVHGLTVPLHGFNGEIGILSLARETPLPGGPARLRLFQRALWLTGAVQARMHVLMLDRATQTPATHAAGRQVTGHIHVPSAT